MLYLLDLDDMILKELMAIKDVGEHHFFTGRRLRSLVMMNRGEPLAGFNQLWQEAFRNPREAFRGGLLAIRPLFTERELVLII